MTEVFEDDGLVVIGLGFLDTKGAIEQYVDGSGLDKVEFAFDTEKEAAKKYGITLVASSVFIDRDGTVSKRFPGGFNKNEMLKETYRILD